MKINLNPEYNMPEIKTGSILISDPFLKDPNFDRTVILICEHNENGSFGLILNKPVEVKLEDVIEDFKGTNKELLIGGPVEQNTLHYIHTVEDGSIPGSVKVANGIFWSGDFEIIKSRIINGEFNLNKIKFFMGYSGWGEGQLQDEINQKTWFVADLGDNTIFEADTNSLWKRIMQLMGGELRWLANSPPDPRMN